MIRHIVLFKLKPGFSFRDSSVLAAEELARQVGEQVPDLLQWQTGRNVTDRAIAYDFAVVGLLTDEEALDRYLRHPFHQKAIEQWREISDWVMADLHEDGPADGRSATAEPPAADPQS